MADLIEKGVLTRVSEVSDWCSPGFFVPESDGRIRLVIYFTHLNRYVKRPVHPFPSTRDILQSIPHDGLYFLKVDAVHRYFQLGLNASSDEWCCHSDKMVTGLSLENCGRHNYLGTNATRTAGTSKNSTRNVSRSQYYNFALEIRAQKGDQFCRAYFQPWRHQTGRQHIQSHRRVPNPTKRISIMPGKPTDNFRPRSGTHDSIIEAASQKGDSLALDKRYGYIIRMSEATFDHNNIWNRFCSTSTTTSRQMVPNPMWIRISYSDPDQICDNRTGRHGHSMGHAEMHILLKGTANFLKIYVILRAHGSCAWEKK